MGKMDVCSTTQGFTLIELLVVIAIIAILAAILIPSFTQAQKKPYDVAALQCGRAIVTAQVTYHAEHQGYANNPNQLGADVAEACAQQGVQVNTHASYPTPATVGDNNLGGSSGNYAFSVYHPNGTGFYRYWVTGSDRLKQLFPFQ